MKKFIEGRGRPGPLMIIGDFPTQREYSSGESFSGAAGMLIQELFRPAGIDTRHIYKTHYYKVPVVGYGSPIKRIREEAVKKVSEIHDWDKEIKDEISLIHPNNIVLCGELALRAMTTESGIGKWRGSIIPLHPRFGFPHINTFPIHSPREIWEQKDKPIVYTQWDCTRVGKYKDLKSAFRHQDNIWIVKSSSELYNWWLRARFGEFLTFDIETHHGFITCIGFCHNGVEAISVPLLVGQKLDFFERGRLYSLTHEILRSKLPKVNQNIKYDWTILENFGFEVSNIVGDTMLMAHTIYPELPVGLDFLTSIYTDHPYYKDEGKKYNPKLHDVTRLLKYNARDALVTWNIWKAQQEDAEAMGVKSFYFNHVHNAFFIYKKMDQTGVMVDDSRRKALLSKYQPMLDKIQQDINMIAEEPINVNSPVQVARYMYDILKCPKATHLTQSGNVALSTDEQTIEEIYVNQVSDAGTKQALKYIIVARKLHKIIQLLNNPISPDGRMRTSYKLQGTETGRTSAGKSLETAFCINERGRIEEIECGGSFQTIGKHGYEFGNEKIGTDLRSIFVPTPGYVFVEGDQGQAEDRVVCVLAEDWDGLAILNKKEFKRNKHGLKDDRHTLTAMLVTGKEFDDITPDDRQERGKKPRHAGNYNMGSGMLSLLTHLPISECRKILEKFHASNPNIRGVFHALVRENIIKFRRLISPHGRRRDFFGRIDEATYKEAYSTIPQATVSDHNKFTILATLVRKYDYSIARPIAESHDSLTFEVKKEYKDAFIEDFKAAIETPISFINCCISRDYNLVIPGEIGWSEEDWSKVK